jgi:hypothetical protein
MLSFMPPLLKFVIFIVVQKNRSFSLMFFGAFVALSR